MNFVIIGASSEIASKFINLCTSKNYEYLAISRSKVNVSHEKNFLKVDDYLDDIEMISNAIEKLTDPILIFFNGALFENRPTQIPTDSEIETTELVNFEIPHKLTKFFKNKNKIKKFIYISTIAAAKQRPKNYIYGSFKRKLEIEISNLNIDNYLFIRFGKVFTSMSKNHNTPPFSLEPEQAGRIILKKINRTGIVYANFGLLLIGTLLRLTPQIIINKVKY